MKTPPDIEPLLKPKEVAALFGVDAPTVWKWALEGRFPDGAIVRTLGGHRRYVETIVRALVNGSDTR